MAHNNRGGGNDNDRHKDDNGGDNNDYDEEILIFKDANDNDEQGKLEAHGDGNELVVSLLNRGVEVIGNLHCSRCAFQLHANPHFYGERGKCTLEETAFKCKSQGMPSSKCIYCELQVELAVNADSLWQCLMCDAGALLADSVPRHCLRQHQLVYLMAAACVTERGYEMKTGMRVVQSLLKKWGTAHQISRLTH